MDALFLKFLRIEQFSSVATLVLKKEDLQMNEILYWLQNTYCQKYLRLVCSHKNYLSGKVKLYYKLIH